VEHRVEHLPARNEVLHAFSDHTKVRRVFQPPEPLELKTGIARMAAWVKDRGAQPPIEFSGEIEVDRNMPPSWREIAPAGGS
jgi:UDP-glucose 4-epimerase